MADNSKIQWTDASWNPIRARNKETGKVGWFCEHMSRGCDNCYAEKMNTNTYFGNGAAYKATELPNLELFLDEKMLRKPLGWRKTRKVFVCSMTDLFARFVPDEWIDRIFAVMALSSSNTFQVLTKRPDRMREYMARLARSIDPLESAAREMGHSFKYHYAGKDIPLLPWPVRNVHLGVSAEDQKTFAERWGHLRLTPAAARFVSMEPLLGAIDMQTELWEDLGEFIWPDWVIVGGESGPEARPCDISNIRSVVEQCRSAGVACFVKQLGSRPFMGVKGFGPVVNDRKGGDIAEFPEDLRVRQFPILN